MVNPPASRFQGPLHPNATDLRGLKRAVAEKFPPGHQFRETVLSLDDVIPADEGAVLLQVLMRMLLTKAPAAGA